jgi:hypothetical protein
MKDWKHHPHDDLDEEEVGYYERFLRREPLTWTELIVITFIAVVVWLAFAEWLQP